MNTLPTGVRQHQTAVVIDVRGGASYAFTNRYERLIESLNGDNIKADIYTLRGDTVGAASLVVGGPDESDDAEDEVIDLPSWAHAEGYTMLLVATCTK